MEKVNNKYDDCPVNEETRAWLENDFLWLTETFGAENIRNRKIILPDYKYFPIKYDGGDQSAFETLKIVAKQMEINPDDILLDIYAEGQSEIGDGGVLGSRVFLQNVKGEKYSGGLYFGKQEDNKYHISLEENKLRDPVGIVATLAHELSHVKLLGQLGLEFNNEHLTDLTTIVFGLGIFNANVAFQMKSSFDSHGWSKSGYLSQMEWGYSLALYAHLREEENLDWIDFLTPNVKADFIQGYDFIVNYPELIYQPMPKSEAIDQINEIYKKIEQADAAKDYEKVIDGYKQLIKIDPNDTAALNNIGYALINQKKYEKAILYFNKAIEIDGTLDFPYNNRGYCELQLGDLDEALTDIKQACDMNPFNAYAWRNLGAYYLKTKEPEKALEYLEEAEKLDPDTELINFYIAMAYERLGNQKMAKEYLNKSTELKEDYKGLNM